jgi:hypothetical protein
MNAARLYERLSGDAARREIGTKVIALPGDAEGEWSGLRCREQID